MYNKYFNLRNSCIANIIYVLISAFLLNSCQTSIDTMIKPESLIMKDTLMENATYLILKNGANISLDDKELYLKSKYADNANVLLIKNTEGYKVRDTVKNVTRIKFKESIIPLTDVKEIHFDKSVYNSELTIISIIVASISVIAVFAYIIDKKLSGLSEKH